LTSHDPSSTTHEER